MGWSQVALLAAKRGGGSSTLFLSMELVPVDYFCVPTVREKCHLRDIFLCFLLLFFVLSFANWIFLGSVQRWIVAVQVYKHSTRKVLLCLIKWTM